MESHQKQLLQLVERASGAKLIGAEIGVATGDTSACLLSRIPQLQLFMVDAWATYSGEHLYRKSGDSAAKLTSQEQSEKAAAARHQTEFAADRRTILNMESTTAAEKVLDGSLDFAFIDADHTYEAVKRDIETWRPKIRRGGVLCGHDYGHPRDRRGIWGVRRAVDEFALENGLEVKVGKGTVWSIQLLDSGAGSKSGCHASQVAAIVPTLGQHAATHDSVGDLLREQVKVFVVDHSGDYSVVSDEIVLRPGVNLGWAAGCNFGIAHARSMRNFEAYLLINNDVRLSKPFVEPLLKSSLHSDGDAFGCLVGARFVANQKDVTKDLGPLSIETVHSVDGCCLLIHRSLYDQVGPLDADTFGFFGFGVDVDYCIRAKQQGFRIVICNNALLWHEHGRTAHSFAGGKDAYRKTAATEGRAGLVMKYGQDWKRLCHATELPRIDSSSSHVSIYEQEMA